jgi:NADH:ubiquinone oxidoreductase subunit 3 (subunit A)
MKQLGVFIFLGVAFLAGVLLIVAKIIWSKASKKERTDYQDGIDKERDDETRGKK